MKFSPSIFASGIFWGMLLLGTAGCAPARTTASSPATIIPFATAAMTPCAQEEVTPKIREVRPAEIRAGDEVTVVASGGYFRDICGGYNEGLRVYKIYLDNEPIADLPCYGNRCEGKFILSDSIAVGSHCMGVQKGTCQMELQVAAK